jgi:periplasmic divalent cation tolerance protein
MSHPEPGGPDAVRVVLITAPDADVAGTLARTLVDEGLVACVSSVGGVRSVFRWDGKTKETEEVLMIAKASSLAVPAVIDRIVDLHPYSVPEVLALPVETGFTPYLEWVEAHSVGGTTE